jgi:hypothetical protein
MWPLPWPTAQAAEIRRLPWRGWPGKGRRRVRGSPAASLWSKTGRGTHAASRAAARRDRDRGELCSGERLAGI